MTDSGFKRYTDRPFPAYCHLPGRTPHPTRNPEGHSFGLPDLGLPDLNHEDWRKSEEYLYGIDLFNGGYWWECHEALEGLWLAAGVHSEAGHALQAVIQCAAAHLKTRMGSATGAMRLHDHSLRHARWSGSRRLGLDLEAMVRDTRAYITVEDTQPALLILNFD